MAVKQTMDRVSQFHPPAPPPWSHEVCITGNVAVRAGTVHLRKFAIERA